MKIFVAVAIVALFSAAAFAHPASAQSVIARGSWQSSCQNAHTYGSTLRATCQKSDGSWVRTSINTSQCANGLIANQNGSLVCGRGNTIRTARGYGYGRRNNGNANNGNGNNGNGWNSVAQMPGGSWSNSCQDASMRGNSLTASCADGSGNNRTSSVDPTQCPQSLIVNRNGYLVCEYGQR